MAARGAPQIHHCRSALTSGTLQSMAGQDERLQVGPLLVTRIGGIAAVVLGIVAAVGVGTDSVESAGVRATAWAGLVVCLTIGARLVRYGVVADSGGILVRGFLRSRRFAWSSVRDLVIAPPPWWAEPRGLGGVTIWIVTPRESRPLLPAMRWRTAAGQREIGHLCDRLRAMWMQNVPTP